MIERVEREVGHGEFPLRKQGTEHERRVVAALPGLHDVHPREVTATNLGHALGRLPLGGGRQSASGLRALGARNGLGQRKRRLRERWQATHRVAQRTAGTSSTSDSAPR